jgi:hypothetical protein
MSNIPTLNWKYIDQFQISQYSQSSVNAWLDGIFTLFNRSTYADGTSRITGSGVAWSFFKTSSFVGGVTEAVYGYPPVMTSVSQSIIFAGTSSFTTITPTMCPIPYSPNPYITNSLYVALQKNSNWKSYTHWTSASMFNSCSVNINTVSSSGYSLLVKNQIANQYLCNIIQAWESQEAIVVSLTSTGSSIYPLNNSASVSVAIAGAFIDPISNDTTIDSEVDGRLYGICSDTGSILNFLTYPFIQGGPGINNNFRFLRSNIILYRPGYLTNETDYLIRAGNKFNDYRFGRRNNDRGPQLGVGTDASLEQSEDEVSFSGKRILYPFHVYEVTGSYAIGTLRNIYVSSKVSPHGVTLKNKSDQTIGYTLGLSTLKSDVCLILKS